MIVRDCECQRCGERVVWVQREPRRAPVYKSPSGAFAGWRTVEAAGRYCDIVWDAESERSIYRQHQCRELGDRRWRPGAADYVPALSEAPPAEHEHQLTTTQRFAMQRAEEKRRAQKRGAMPMAAAIPPAAPPPAPVEQPKERGLLDVLGE